MGVTTPVTDSDAKRTERVLARFKRVTPSICRRAVGSTVRAKALLPVWRAPVISTTRASAGV